MSRRTTGDPPRSRERRAPSPPHPLYPTFPGSRIMPAVKGRPTPTQREQSPQVLVFNRKMANDAFDELVSEIRRFAATATNFSSLQEFTVARIRDQLAYYNWVGI